MITVDSALRSRLQSNVVVKPTATVRVRKVVPGWTRLSDKHGYIQHPDLMTGGCEENATGTLIEEFGGWNNVIPGDSASLGDSIVRAYVPAAVGDDDGKILLFASSTLATSGGFDTPFLTINTSGSVRPKTKCRPGVVADGIYYAFIIGAGGSVCKFYGDAGGSWTSPSAMATTDRYASVAGAAIAPLGQNEFFVLHTDDNRVIKLDYYDGGYVFTDHVVGYCYDDEPHWSTLHWFDAEKIGDRIVLTISTSYKGSSKAYIVQGASVSDAITIMGHDELDWTGTFRVSGLSIANSRIYAVGGMRILQSDNYYSPEIGLVLWTDNGDFWAAPGNLSTGVEFLYGKIHAIGDYVAIVDPTRVLSGGRTVDFGGDGTNVQLDVTSQTESITYQPTVGLTGSEQTVALKRGGPLADIDWMDYAHQVVCFLGDDQGQQRIFVGDVDTISHPRSDLQKTYMIKSRGLMSRLRAMQPMDEIINLAISENDDFSPPRMIHIGGSIWDVDGHLRTLYPNDNNESIAFSVDEISGSFVLGTRVKYEANADKFGIVLFAGVTKDTENELAARGYSSVELPVHNFYYIQLEPVAGVCTPKLYQRVGLLNSENEWEETDTLIATGSAKSIPADTDTDCFVIYRNSTLSVYFWIGGWWSLAMTYSFDGILPERHQVGLYAVNPQGRVRESVLAGKTEIGVDGLDDWASSGNVTINGAIYEYTHDGTTLTISRPLDEFLSTATVLTQSDSQVEFGFFQVATAHKRLCVWETAKLLCMRSGVQLIPDNLSENISGWTVPYGGASYGSAKWNMSGGVVVSDLECGDISIEQYYSLDNFTSSNGGFLLWGDKDGNGTRAGVLAVGGSTYIYVKDSSSEALTASSILPAPSIPQSGYLNVVTSWGWIHFYVNGIYVGGFYRDDYMYRYGLVGLTGDNFSVSIVNYYVGNTMAEVAAWDASKPARNVLAELTQNLPLIITENDASQVRLQHVSFRDDLGTVPFTRVERAGPENSISEIATASVFFGAETWITELDEYAIERIGLWWGKMQDNRIRNPLQAQKTAKEKLAYAAGGAKRYLFTGSVDIAMRIGDEFTIDSAMESYGLGSGTFMVESMSVIYDSNEPILNMSCVASEVPRAALSGDWDTDYWNSFDWSS